MNLNGVEIKDINHLEKEIQGMDEQNKTFLRNEYLGISNVTTLSDLEKSINLEKLRIEKREKDGKEMYQLTQAKLRLKRLQLGISDFIYTQYVYDPLDMLINKVSTGNWLDAYNIIDNIQTNPYLSKETILTFKLIISNYIVKDGDYIEYRNRSVDQETGKII